MQRKKGMNPHMQESFFFFGLRLADTIESQEVWIKTWERKMRWRTEVQQRLGGKQGDNSPLHPSFLDRLKKIKQGDFLFLVKAHI